MRRFLGVALLAVTLGLSGQAADATADDSSNILIDKYLEASKVQQDYLRDAKMDIDIDASIPKWKKFGQAHAMRLISKLGKVTFAAIRLSGDDTVKKEVIARYLEAEQQTRDYQSMAISPANYKFKYKGVLERDKQRVHIFQLTPRKKAVGLFKGELWLDETSSLPVREAGRFVKSPSIWLRSVDFVREYEIHDGVSVPKRIASSIDTRIAGVAEIGINFSNFTKGTTEPEVATPLANAQ